MRYSKTCVKRLLSKNRKLVFNTNCRFMQVKSIADCSNGSILQYFRHSLSYIYLFSLRSLFCLLLSGRFTKALMYCIFLLDCIQRVICQYIYKPMSEEAPGADLISNFRVRGVRQNSPLKQANPCTLEYSGDTSSDYYLNCENSTIRLQRKKMNDKIHML